ncbi:hypothetical protein ALP54_04892 [Pseudomonas amygdali pv. lachrymans]|nr:hypothetical protein ALP54_04892 [Pseudomonas amygdali pv. lachrymans]RMV83843.1 hypothetical protein ALP04_01429 [Pseudomonas amygdali pv. sesami]
MRNDNLDYRATLGVGMSFWTLCVLFCDAERHETHFYTNDTVKPLTSRST